MMINKVNFDDLTFEKFRELALAEGLSNHERVGFPNEYREGKEDAIFLDIRTKLSALVAKQKTILEIGPGCGQLPVMLDKLCVEQEHKLHLVDSAEMLQRLPDSDHVQKWYGCYPEKMDALFELLEGKVDAVISYSVVQYVFSDGNIWDFLDRTLSLLAEGGEMLLGDIPNITMRKRFFSSSAGVECHRQYTGGIEAPDIQFNKIERKQIDDSVVFAILARARAQGFHAWVVPQSPLLPMANRREDILIRRP